MTREVLRVSGGALPTRAFGLHVGAALGLLAATWTGLDRDGVALAVLRGVAVLLAAAVALAVNEPSAAQLDASPTPFAERVAARLAWCAGVVVPAWGLALAVTGARGAQVPAGALTLELAALVALALSVPAALRRWWRVSEPAVVTGPLLLGVLLAASHLPRALVLLPTSPADLAWDGAHARWAVVLLAALALLSIGLSDPSTARGVRRRR